MRRPAVPLLLLAATACGTSTPVAAPSAEADRPGPPVAPVVPAEAAAAAGALPPGAEPPLPSLRLPRDLVPRGYRATLHLNPAQPAFTGTLWIDGEIARATPVLWLNARGLEVDSATALVGDKPVALTAETPGNELLSLRAAAPLPTGATTIEIRYHGTIDDRESMGIFRQRETADWYVFSKFEPIYARRVFPCIDEPDRKVPWQLTLEVPAAQIALSNTLPVEERPLADGWKRVTFARTLPLPSYLVAFAVGPFEIVDAGKTASGAPVRIIATRGRTADTQLAAELMPKLIAYLERWFDFPFPFDKLDLVPIPLTVGFGCMENPGLVTCAAEYMLFDPAKTTPKDRRGLAGLGGHELAHMWFGDLVTMAWWNDLWLNEGMATWIEDRAIREVVPAWDADVADLEGRRDALGADRLATARAVRQPIAARDDILNAFDGITYSKGGALASMFERWLGPETFQAGIRAYIKAHAFGSATTEDLIAALAAASGRDVSALSGFVEQAGAPRLRVGLRCPAGQPPSLQVTQDRYLPPGATATETATTTAAPARWTIPLCIAYDRDGARAERCTVVEAGAAAAELPLEATACPRWVWPNAAGNGYYRLAMSQVLVEGLAQAGWKALTSNERAVFLGDLVTMIRDGEIPLRIGIDLVPAMLAEENRMAVREAVAIASRDPSGSFLIESLLELGDHPAYEAWVVARFGPLARKLRWSRRDGEPYDYEQMRRDVLPLVARAGDSPWSRQAYYMSSKWRDLPRDIRQAVLVAAINQGRRFDELYPEVFGEQDREARRTLLMALASVEEEKKLTRALDLLLDERLDIRETAPMLFVPSTVSMRRVAAQFLRDHLDAVLARYPAESQKIGHAYFASVFTSACDPARRDEIAAFVTEHFGSVPGGHRAVQQKIEAMDQCIAWRRLMEPQVALWLDAGKKARR